jgi:hypothetical protein
MRFEELKDQIKTCKFEEVRVDNNDFFEAVLRKANLDTIHAKLISVFGPSTWPSESKLTSEVQEVIQPFGGIMSGQTLYFTHMDEWAVFAMFWPWGDKERVTLKLGRNQPSRLLGNQD